MFEQPLVGDRYALVAQVGTDRITSRSFTPAPGDEVEGDLETNAIFYGGDPPDLTTP